MNREAGWGLQERRRVDEEGEGRVQGWGYQLHKAGRVKTDNRPEQRGL